MSLQKFQAKINEQGLARANKYVARIFPPRGLTSTGNILSGLFPTGSNVNVNLPGVDLLDTAVQQINNLSVDLGPVNVGKNFGIPTLGYALSGMGEKIDCLNLFCAAANIPARDIESFQGQQYGEAREIGVRHIHSDLTLTYYCSEDLREKLFFENWQNLIFNPFNKQHGYYEDYTSRVEVLTYDYSMREIKSSYRFLEAWPTNVGALSFDTGTSDILRLDIAFKFRNYERIS